MANHLGRELGCDDTGARQKTGAVAQVWRPRPWLQRGEQYARVRHARNRRSARNYAHHPSVHRTNELRPCPSLELSRCTVSARLLHSFCPADPGFPVGQTLRCSLGWNPQMQNKNNAPGRAAPGRAAGGIQRRGWDSNPRAVRPSAFKAGAFSRTLPPLQWNSKSNTGTPQNERPQSPTSPTLVDCVSHAAGAALPARVRHRSRPLSEEGRAARSGPAARR
jgi:hypothetical protein